MAQSSGIIINCDARKRIWTWQLHLHGMQKRIHPYAGLNWAHLEQTEYETQENPEKEGRKTDRRSRGQLEMN